MNRELTFELVRRAQEGDTRAFGQLFERHRPRLETLVHLRLGDRLRQKIEPADIVQETSLSAFRSIQQFQWVNQGSFFQWLAGIAEHVIRNQVRHFFKTKKRGGGSPDAAGMAPAVDPDQVRDANGVSPLRQLMREERFERLENALKSLSPDHREIIILARVEGLRMSEIAARMNRSVDAASMLLLRALRQLKGVFGTTGSLSLPDRALQVPRESSSPDDPAPAKSNGRSPPDASGSDFRRISEC